jgi:hypothetical protein
VSECANAAFNNDVTQSAGAVLCRTFNADCMFTAWGGITLPGIAAMYPYTFSSLGAGWSYDPWDFPSFPVSGVVINLGTNDRPVAPDLLWQQQYVEFVGNISKVRGTGAQVRGRAGQGRGVGGGACP